MEIKKITILIIVLLLATGFGSGWFLRSNLTKLSSSGCKSSPLRINTFKLVKPLLVCDTSTEKGKAQNTSLQNNLNSIVENAKRLNNVSEISVYFQDFNTDARIDINRDSKFNPASLNKVAIMIAVYKIIESDPAILLQKTLYTGGDQNSGQELMPGDYLKKGQTYSVDEIIKKMIQYSDNNAFYVLLSSMDHSILESLYKDLQVSTSLLNPNTPDDYDYITTKDASYFFRVLFNSTYLSQDMSEKALETLSNTDYKKGIVAGVPKNITVAHKFGLITIKQDGDQIIRRELHDCGIIYHEKNPYLLCIMTKSTSSIENIEGVIKNISETVYKFQDSR